VRRGLKVSSIWSSRTTGTTSTRRSPPTNRLVPSLSGTSCTGRGAQEETLAELKDGFAFNSVPTNPYAANSAWRQRPVLAMNLLRRFSMETTASARPLTRKRTFLYVLESIKTARFTWLNVAGRLVFTNGMRTLRLSSIPAVHKRYESLEYALASAD
jgi:hypothetical protein